MIKYQKIALDIKDDILRGKYKPNEQLPFEKEICEKYNVSKMTVKKALDLLVGEGLIIKRRGSGTFVKDITENEIQGIIEKKQFSGLTNTNLGHKVTSKVLEFKIINASETIADMLKIEKDEFIYHEMISNVPMAVNPDIKKVLIIGGGDGGTAREVCRFKTVEQVDMVEIDERVVRLCQKYFPADRAY